MNEIAIQVKGLAPEVQLFYFQADTDFVKGFGDLVLAADCGVEIGAARRGDWIEANIKIDGKVVVECDRCLENLEIPVSVDEQMSVRFDKAPDSVENTDDNVMVLPEGETMIDFSQCVYDFICLCVPLQKVHREGECNPDMIARLGESGSESKVSDTPFSGLKDLLEKETIKNS